MQKMKFDVSFGITAVVTISSGCLLQMASFPSNLAELCI